MTTHHPALYAFSALALSSALYYWLRNYNMTKLSTEEYTRCANASGRGTCEFQNISAATQYFRAVYTAYRIPQKWRNVLLLESRFSRFLAILFFGAAVALALKPHTFSWISMADFARLGIALSLFSFVPTLALVRGSRSPSELRFSAYREGRLRSYLGHDEAIRNWIFWAKSTLNIPEHDTVVVPAFRFPQVRYRGFTAWDTINWVAVIVAILPVIVLLSALPLSRWVLFCIALFGGFAFLFLYQNLHRGFSPWGGTQLADTKVQILVTLIDAESVLDCSSARYGGMGREKRHP